MSQKAIIQIAVGAPLVLQDRPIPEPIPGYVLVKVHSVGLNPHDGKARDFGLYTKDSLPTVVSNDVAGEIIMLGPSETGHWKVGDRIMSQSNIFLGRDHGGLQQYCLLPANVSSRIPDNITYDQAASIPTNATSSFIAFFTSNGLGWPLPGSSAAQSWDAKNQMLLIVGGGGQCGKYGVQLAHLAGIGTTIVVAGKANEAELRSYGATHVIDRHSDDVLGQIRSITGDGLIYAFDCINGEGAGDRHNLAVAALSNSKRGKLAHLLPGDPDPEKIGEKSAGFESSQVRGHALAHPVEGQYFWDHIGGWLADGSMKPLAYEVVEGLDAGKVNKVLDNYRDGKRQGKVHVHPW